MSDKDRAKEEAAKQAAYEKEMAPYREQSKRDQERERIIQDAIKKGVKFDEQGRVKMKKGGKVSQKEWEGSAEDEAQDKKLAKKHGMTFDKWEKSKMDVKHDKQQSMKGLKAGGMKAYAKGGSVSSRADGCATKGKTKGKMR